MDKDAIVLGSLVIGLVAFLAIIGNHKEAILVLVGGLVSSLKYISKK